LQGGGGKRSSHTEIQRILPGVGNVASKNRKKSRLIAFVWRRKTGRPIVVAKEWSGVEERKWRMEGKGELMTS